MTAQLEAGELVLLVDRKDRRYLVRLEPGGEFHSHAGAVAHGDLIGGPAGINIRSSGGGTYLVVRPTLSDFILKMPTPRGKPSNAILRSGSHLLSNTD